MTSVSPISSASPSAAAAAAAAAAAVAAAQNPARQDSAASPHRGPQQVQLGPQPVAKASTNKLHPSIATRPPLRSNFDLEPNPFEQSFSSTSAVSQSSLKTLNSDTQRADSDRSVQTKDADTNAQGEGADRINGDDTKPVLPPLASIVSPAEPFSNWGMSNSLRAGPLSPAMLTGPANQTSLGLGAFDSSFVRTGLTPDVSRTGFTPLIAGGGFPPPTPNTAALFAIVNGTSAGQPLSTTAAITPNTLNALNGVLNGNLGVGTTAVPLDSQSNGQHMNSQYNDGRHEPNGRQNGSYGYQPDSYADNVAASALYLLSQQNSMRPQPQIAPSALTNQPDQHDQQQQQLVNGSIDPEETGRRGATKRKSMDTPAAPASRGGKKAKAAPAPSAPVRTSSRRRSTRAGTEDMDEDDDDDDDETYSGLVAATATTNGRQTSSNAGGKAAQKKPETEEEKRRNFLERNRQAALKCRQRKKKWLQDLQAKVEFLTTENERLTNALIASREEIARLSQLVVAHGGAPSNLASAPNDLPPTGAGAQHMSSQPVSINVSLPGVSKPLPAAVPLPSSVGHPAHQAPQGVTVGRGYGY